jgi:hypothetical protein
MMRCGVLLHSELRMQRATAAILQVIHERKA